MKMQNTTLRILLASLLSLALLVGIGVQGTASAAAKLTITPNPLIVSPDSEIIITVTRTNDDGTTEIVTEGTWSIGDPSVVTIDKDAKGNWVAHGHKAGEVTLTFTDNFGNAVTVMLISDVPAAVTDTYEYSFIIISDVPDPEDPEKLAYGIYFPGDDFPTIYFNTLAEALAYATAQGATRIDLLDDATETGDHVVTITFQVRDGHTLTIQNGTLSIKTDEGILALTDGATLIVDEGGQLLVDEGGQLYLFGDDTKLTVETGGTITVTDDGLVAGAFDEEGATIELKTGSEATLGGTGDFYDGTDDVNKNPVEFNNDVIDEDTTFVWHGEDTLGGGPFDGFWVEEAPEEP